MGVDFNSVRQLENAAVERGSRWIYVADFNIKHSGNVLKNTSRIDAELEDLVQLKNSGAAVAVLAHEGRFKDGAGELDFAVPHLSRKLGARVKYFKENDTQEAEAFANSLKPGDVAVMGNVRKHAGEEKNDPELAVRFARLGSYVAVGGFGKAHRSHASNVGILEYLPGYAARSQVREMKSIAGWAGKEAGAYSVAVLGGVKKEKITVGLVGLAASYDAVIPGGIVLNTALQARKCFGIGDSVVEDSGKTFRGEVEEVLEGVNGEKVLLPDIVIVGEKTPAGYKNIHPVRITKNGSVQDGFQITGFIMSKPAKCALDRAVSAGGRILMAGTPDLFTEGIGLATAETVQRLRQKSVRGAVLGGDTAAEIKYDGTVSTGGGAALYFVANGTTPVFEALRANKMKFHIN